jgi:hypothetical protein
LKRDIIDLVNEAINGTLKEEDWPRSYESKVRSMLTEGIHEDEIVVLPGELSMSMRSEADVSSHIPPYAPHRIWRTTYEPGDMTKSMPRLQHIIVDDIAESYTEKREEKPSWFRNIFGRK